MAKSKKGTIHVDTGGMTNHVKPKLDDAHNKMEHIYREWYSMSTPPDFDDGEELKNSIWRTIHDIEDKIGAIWPQVLAVANQVTAAEKNNKNIIDSLGSGKLGKSSSKNSGKSEKKSGGKSASKNLRDSLGKGTGWYGSVVGEENAKEKDQLAKAQEFWSANMANQQQGNGNVNNTGNIGSGNVSSAWGSSNGYVASSAAVGAFGGSSSAGTIGTSNSGNVGSSGTSKSDLNDTNNTSGTTNNGTNETKPPENVSNVLKLYDDDGNPLITAKTVDGKDVFYDVKTGKELTTIGAEGTEWSNETTYLQKTKELATKNGSETDYYATVDSQNGRVVLLGKVGGEWKVIKTYDSNFEAKGTITDTKSDIDISGNTSNTNSTTSNHETVNNGLTGVWKIDNKKAETSTGEKYWTIYTKNGDTEGTIKKQGFYATDKSLTDYKNEENCGLNEEAAKWIYDNIPTKTTVEIILLNEL